MNNIVEDNLFPPGEFIQDELDARDWTQGDLAGILGRPLTAINQIILGKKRITSQTAQELAAAFGTSAELWVNLEASYRLALEKESQGPVARRAKLYELGPVKEMLKRHWITKGDTIEDLEAQVCEFFEIASVDQEPQFVAAAARKSTDYADSTPAQLAWLCRAKKLAQGCMVAKYSSEALEKHLGELHALTTSEQEVRRVPEVLAQMGIRFVVVKHLPRTKLDGAAFWPSKNSPVIVLSLRFDRIDWFWHTLAHELRHVYHRDGTRVDNDLVSSPRTTVEEERADREASDFLIPHELLDSFIARLQPRFSKQRIIQFANLHRIHPGIVVGQLQYRKAIKYSHSREMLVGVRSIITETALTDGWGTHPGI